MTNVTRILAQIDKGDPSAADQLLPLVYDELRKLATARLANESPGQTLQATALVHEAYARLVRNADNECWDGRGHFFAAAAESMRRILIGRARDKARLKRGGDRKRLNLDSVCVATETPNEELIALDEALDLLATEDTIAADVVKLRFFAGLTMQQIAYSLKISTRTAERQWSFARAWLFDQLVKGDE